MDGEVTIAKKKERKARKGKKEQRRKYGKVRTAKKKGKKQRGKDGEVRTVSKGTTSIKELEQGGWRARSSYISMVSTCNKFKQP